VALPDGPVVVDAGQTRRFEPSGASGAPLPPAGSVQDQVASLQAENEALRAQLAEANFTGAVARGQVAATQGEPVPWPEDLPAAFRPEGFEALLRAEVAKQDGFEVHSLDCSEYPCVTTVMAAPGTEDLQAKVRALAEGISEGLGGDVGTWMGLSLTETEAGTAGGVGMAFAPEDDMKDDAVRTRLDFRASNTIKDLGEEIEHDHPDAAAGKSLDLEDVMQAVPRRKAQPHP
jgi:hypothetical protein